MDSDKYFEYLIKEAVKNAQSFSGWDFSHLTSTGRIEGAPLKWNYYNIVSRYLTGVTKLLDMGTGGGEILSKFSPLPLVTYATEQYNPNVAVARKGLEPLGVKVIEIEEEKEPPFNSNLPFEDDFFDLIINRHEAYYPPELMRILRPEGMFITQQVGGRTNQNLVNILNGEPSKYSKWNLESAVKELESAGFTITRQQEEVQFYRYYDIGAVVYHLIAIPWTIEDFSTERYKDKLLELHKIIESDGFYDAVQHRFMLIARK